jgi:hypothetical protein
MAKLYFGFGISDSMFSGDVKLSRQDLHEDASFVQYLLNNPQCKRCEETVICLNPSHKASIDAMVEKYGLNGITIPDHAPIIKMQPGDYLIVMSPRGLPRLVDRHEYSKNEIDNATFNFSIWGVE